MAQHIRILTVHTSDMSHKMPPLKAMLCRVRSDCVVAGRSVTPENIHALLADGTLDGQNVDEALDLSDLRLSQARLKQGASSIESDFDDALSSPYIIGAAIEAEQDGCDAVVIDCMGDPALHAAREAVRIPVVGAGEASMHIAATLGHTFSVVTIMDRVRPILESRMKTYGLYERCASVRAIEAPVLHIQADRSAIFHQLFEQSLEAITHDKADVIVLGCTGFFGATSYIENELAKSGITGVPIIDPLPAAAATARALLAVGLSHSLATYPPPPVKPRTGYLIPDQYHS